jgi:hypothetical protein
MSKQGEKLRANLQKKSKHCGFGHRIFRKLIANTCKLRIKVPLTGSLESITLEAVVIYQQNHQLVSEKSKLNFFSRIP